MSYTLRPAKRENTKPLIGIYSQSGCGKTWSSLLLARGFVGNGKIGMIETESGRGEAYSGVSPVGEYLVCSMREPFSPQAYGEAIAACEKAKVDALIIDSASHEWEAIGGVLDMAAENQAKGWTGQIVWTRPKLEHSRYFTLRLLQTPIPLVIVCMRAKFPLVEFIDEKGKKNMKRADAPSPKQSDDILYEMFIHGWIEQDHTMRVTKYPKAIPELRGIVRDGEPITIETGQRLAQWAAGKTSAPPPTVAAGDPLDGDSATAGADHETAPHAETVRAKASQEASAQHEAAAPDDFAPARAKLAAAGSMGALAKAWAEIGPTARIKLEAVKEECKKRSMAADKKK